MKLDKGLRYIILGAILVAIFFGCMQMYGRSTNGRENILEGWNETAQNVIKVPTRMATLRRVDNEIVIKGPEQSNPEQFDPVKPEDEWEEPEVTGEGAERIVSACASVWAKWANKGGYYSKAAQTWTDGSNHRMDCSAYVSQVITDAGISGFENLPSSSALGGILSSHGFVNIGSYKGRDALVTNGKAGDIMVFAGHAQIYVGDGKCYSNGGADGGGSVQPDWKLADQNVPKDFKRSGTYTLYRYQGD